MIRDPRRGCDVVNRLLPPGYWEIEPLTGDALEAAAGDIRVGASPGYDNWAGADLKVLPKAAWEQLAVILGEVERTQRWPEELLHSWTALIPKVDDPASPNELRPIRVLPTVYRLWSSTRLKEVMRHLDPLLPPEILAYRQGWDLKLRMVELQDELANRHADGKLAFGLALDASKAFPSLRRSVLEHIARRVGFPGQLWNSHYHHGDTSWRLAGQWVSQESLKLEVGLSQGCPLSVVLYNLFMLPLVTELASRGVLVVDYADDLTIIANTREELLEALHFVTRYLEDGGIALNASKSQYFMTEGDPAPLVLPDATLLPQDTVKILGHVLQVNFSQQLDREALPLTELLCSLERAAALGYFTRVGAIPSRPPPYGTGDWRPFAAILALQLMQAGVQLRNGRLMYGNHKTSEIPLEGQLTDAWRHGLRALLRAAALHQGAAHRRDFAGIGEVNTELSLSATKAMLHPRRMILSRIMAGGMLTAERLARWAERDGHPLQHERPGVCMHCQLGELESESH
eukprot:1599373-Amphidinium_carterae.1